MRDLFIALFIFIITVGFILLVVYIIVSIPKGVRIWRLSRIAKKFGLTFENYKLFEFSWSTPLETKKNILRGSINGHSVEIYDYLIPYAQRAPLGNPPGQQHISKRCTVAVVDNIKKEIWWFGWYAPIFKIRKVIKNLT
jgi:hypothetical protein